MAPAQPASYGRQPVQRGSTVVALDPGGPADRAGVEVGDRLLAADGEILRDVIDWLWIADGRSVEIEVAPTGSESRWLTLEREAGEGWGIDFAELVFDGTRVCKNQCEFCFMSQLPPGMRPSLYLKDDDYRLSFLQGNFITLTNLRTDDLTRIVDQRLSPLYVSLHAVDAEVRAKLICSRGPDTAVDDLASLLEAGIEVHVQIVLVPDVNDDAVLATTVDWLASREGVRSVGIVPVGYTGHRTPGDSYASRDASEEFLQWIQPRAASWADSRGEGWLQLADEFYLNARVSIPAGSYYADYPQYENGIGMVRAFIDDFGASRDREGGVLSRRSMRPATILTGELFAPVLASLLAQHDIDHVSVAPVPSRFFGGNVSVAGLLTGSDLLAVLEGAAPDQVYLVPECVFNADGVTLDDMTFDQLSAATDVSLTLVSCDPDALEDALIGNSERA